MQQERYNSRDLTYSAWHRAESAQRFVAPEKALKLSMIDVDGCLWVEFDKSTREPLLLIETAKDTGQDFKPATVIKNLAVRANLTAYVVLYTISNQPNPANRNHLDISRFRVMRLHPNPESHLKVLTPAQWASELVVLRDRQAAISARGSA